MARYKLTKTEEGQGDKHFYSIECIDEWDDPSSTITDAKLTIKW